MLSDTSPCRISAPAESNDGLVPAMRCLKAMCAIFSELLKTSKKNTYEDVNGGYGYKRRMRTLDTQNIAWSWGDFVN